MGRLREQCAPARVVWLMLRPCTLAVVGVLVCSCGEDSAPIAAGATAGTSTGAGVDPATTGADRPATSDGGPANPSDSSEGSSTDASADDTGAVTTDGDTDGDGRPEEGLPKPEFIPAPSGPCPEFEGEEITLFPDGVERRVRLWIGEEATKQDGPLVFSWHGWHGSPGPYVLSTEGRAELMAMGGILVAPHIDEADEDQYWDMDDVRLADEVLACAIDKVGVDLRHIHTAGLSAGGRQSVLLAYQRSGYIASFVSYSPGTRGGSLVSQDPENLFAGVITHGGTSEDAIFQDLAESYFNGLVSVGHFAAICVHDQGHTIPNLVQAQALGFLMDHPFGLQPSPYADGLPPTFPRFCQLTL